MLRYALAYARLLDMQGTQHAAVKAIRLHLAAINKSQVWLADQLGVSQFYIGRRMTGAVTFNVEDLDRIAEVFGRTTDQLLADSQAVAA